MTKIGITADSSSSLEYAPFPHNVKITRTAIHFGTKEYMDGKDITPDQFYNLLEQSDIVPSTSAPATGMLVSKAEELMDEGCTDVIHFAISTKLSAYGNNCQPLVSSVLEDEPINYHVFDSKSACIMEGINAHYAEILASKGYTVEEIFAECNKVIANTDTYFVVDDLKYLVKNGRLSGAAGMLGSLMKIKPLLRMTKDGQIITYEKIRTHQKAVERMIECAIESAKDAKKVLYIVLHTNRKEDCEKLQNNLLSQVNNCYKTFLTTVPPTIGAHIGSRILGIATIILDDLKEELF